MLPRLLSLQNFLSYGDHRTVLDFSQFNVACLSGNNGHGKSALLDAITYALWGEGRKGRSERKPDEGLLHIGAKEMRVEFCFDLDKDLFRVIRSYRREKRGGTAELDLQIFSRTHQAYRSLTEGSSNTRTQERIKELLAIDYETFINSAFIAQGRIDEFSSKDAGQRKRILGEILGLSQYDRMQEVARQRLSYANGRRVNLEKRLLELDSLLSDREDLENGLKGLDDRLNQLSLAMEANEKKLMETQTELSRCEHMRRELQDSASLRREFQERSENLLEERNELEIQLGEDASLIASGDEIEAQLTAFLHLDLQERQLRAAAAQFHQLDSECRRVENELLAKRHQMDEHRAFWSAKVESLYEQRERFREILATRGAIEIKYQELVAARDEHEVLEGKRSQHHQLDRERERIAGEIELEEGKLCDAVARVRAHKTTIQAELQRADAVDRQRQGLQEQLEALWHLERNLERTRDREGDLRLELAEKEQHLVGMRTTRDEVSDKIALLDHASAANCPLCGSELDQQHEDKLRRDLQFATDKFDYRIAEASRILEERNTLLKEIRAEYKRLERSISPIRKLESRHTQLCVQMTQFEKLKTDLEQLESEAATLQERISTGDFASSKRKRLQEFLSKIEALDYFEEAYLQATELLTSLGPAETDLMRLRDAEAGEQHTNVTLEQAEQKRQLAEDALHNERYAAAEKNSLEQLRCQLAELGYESAQHENLRKELDRLKGAETIHAKLLTAKDRTRQNISRLEHCDRELKTLVERLDAIDQLGRKLNRELGEEKRLEEMSVAFEETLQANRVEREELLQDRGSLISKLDRLNEIVAERKVVAKEVSHAQETIWIYKRLVEAFGRDGIQALIMENSLPEIEEEANGILSRLTDNRIQISIESLRDLKKGGTKETMDIKIADELGERSYDLYSGGETFRTDFALRIALSKVLARRSGTQLRTLIIDEGFGTQDSQGLEQLIQAIQRIGEDFEMVLVVTHLDQLKNAFPVRIEITKDPERGSQLEVIHTA